LLASSQCYPPSQTLLETPFEDCGLFTACLFLRFIYCPTDLTPANLSAARGSLLGLLRLAHKLNAMRIMDTVSDHMAGGAGTCWRGAW